MTDSDRIAYSVQDQVASMLIFRHEHRDHIVPEFTDAAFDRMLRSKAPIEGIADTLLNGQYGGRCPATLFEFFVTMPDSVWMTAVDYSKKHHEKEFDDEIILGGARMWISDLYFQMRYEIACHKFVVSPGLATKLWNTSPAGIERKFLRLPFPTIEVTISGDEFIYGKDERLCWRVWQDNGMDIPEWAGEREEDQVINTVFGFTPKSGGEFIADGNRSTVLNDKLITESTMIGDLTDLVVGGVPLTMRDAMNFIYNVLLYMNLHTRDQVEDKARIHQVHSQLQGMKGAKRKPLEEKMAEYKRSPIFILGKSVTLPGDTPPEAIRLDSPQRRTHWRRGHWKRQACGKLWSEHKWIHVEPTLVRGYGDVVVKDYRIVDEQRASAP